MAILAPSPTPMPLSFSGPICDPTLSGGLWCFAWAANDTGSPLEGVAAAISLLDEEGTTIAAQTAYSPLNLILEDEPVILAAHFDPVGGQPERAAVTLVSALALSDTSRYLPVEVETTSQSATPTGLGWRVQGRVRLDVEEEVDVARGIVVVTALDDHGRPVGLTIWEFSGTVGPGAPVAFDLMVFSHGPRIARAAVAAEAQPAGD